MAKKKVVDAEILLQKLNDLSYRNWCPIPYTQSNIYGVNNLDDALRMAGQQINSQMSQSVNAALSTVMIELKMAITAAMRDEDGGMCGLCRVNPDEVMPVDYRPNPSI